MPTQSMALPFHCRRRHQEKEEDVGDVLPPWKKVWEVKLKDEFDGKVVGGGGRLFYLLGKTELIAADARTGKDTSATGPSQGTGPQGIGTGSTSPRSFTPTPVDRRALRRSSSGSDSSKRNPRSQIRIEEAFAGIDV